MEKRERYLDELDAYAVRKREVIEVEKLSIIRDTKLKLSGGPGFIDAISCTDKKRFVILSDKILYEGDCINGFKIIKIYEDHVEFEKDGKVWVQDLLKNEIEESKNGDWGENDVVVSP